jgi:hypothetical protein
MENQRRRRIAAIRLALFHQHGVQVQPEADEGGEEDQVAHADDASGEVLEAVDHRDPAGDVGQDRGIAGEEVGDHRIGRDGEDEAHGDREDEGDHLVAGQRRHR